MPDPLILQADLAPSQPEMVLGTGLPTKIEGRDVHYRRKEVARAGNYVHRGSGNPFSIDAARMDKWVDSFKRRAAKGIRPFVTPKHVDHHKDPDARDTLGYVVGMERSGDSLYAVEQLIGDEALAASSANDVSVYVVADALDSDGEKYPESLHHLSLTPIPALTNLGGYMTIAASAGGGAAQSIPVYVLSAAAERNTPMRQETLQKLRAKLNLAADVKDEDVAEKAAALALADPPADKTAEVTALSAANAKLTADLAAANGKVLSLSASSPRQPDDVTKAMFAENISEKRKTAIRSGAISIEEAAVFDALLADGNGMPNTLALSAAGADRRPFAFGFWDAVSNIGQAKAVKGQNAMARLSAAADPVHRSHGDNQQEDAATVRENARIEASKWQDRELAARGMK